MWKRYGDILRKWVSALLAAVLLAGCAAGGAASGSADSISQSGSARADTPPVSTPESVSVPENTPASESVPEPTAPFVMPDGMHWAVEPTLELDYMLSCSFFRADTYQHFNQYGMITPDGLSEACIGGKSGLIDHNGTWAAPCEFKNILCGADNRYCLERYDEENNVTSFILDDKNGLHKISEELDGHNAAVAITGTSMPPSLCWVAQDQTLSMYSDCAVYPTYSALKPLNYPVRALYMPENEGKLNTVLNGKKYYDWYPDFDAMEYVLYDGNGSVTAERYESIGCVADGIVPARKDGKWGFIDIYGNTVFPFEYDGSILYLSESGTAEHGGCWNATEGTVVLCKEDGYALYTVSGGEIIPFGVFEQLLPVYKGRLWAKANGKWGVLELDSAV